MKCMYLEGRKKAATDDDRHVYKSAKDSDRIRESTTETQSRDDDDI